MKIGKYGGGNMAQAQGDHVPFLFDKNLGAGLRLSAAELTSTKLLAAMPAKRRSLFRPVCCQDNLVVEG